METLDTNIYTKCKTMRNTVGNETRKLEKEEEKVAMHCRKNPKIFWIYIDSKRIFCGLRNAESCHGVICGKSSVECSANYPYAFPHFTAEKFRISTYRRTTVHSLCITDVQPMHSSIQHPPVPSFRILCGAFAKEQGSFFYNFD